MSAFGRWQPTGERRAGGTAEVLQVTDGRVTGALKLARDAGPCARMLVRERDALRAIAAKDPAAAAWIVTVLDAGELDGRPWVVLPWYPWTLGAWAARAPDPGAVLHACEQATETLFRFQQTGVSLGRPRLHRDVKPDNFLVGADGRVVLADVGASREGSLAEVVRATTMFTPRYAPPEQCLPLARPPDPSVDAHALAVTIYACLTGREPDAKGHRLPLTAAGGRLLDIQDDPSAREERDRLAAAPLGELLALDELHPLFPADVHRLRHRLEEAAPGDPARAAAALAHLLPALELALAPDPARRDGDLRRLSAALEAARLTLAGSPGTATPRSSPPPTVPPGPPSLPEAPAARTFVPAPATALPREAPPPAPPPEPAADPEDAPIDDDPLARYALAGLGAALLLAVGWALLRPV